MMMMSDKPILFSSDMIRALLDGRKTQTRRILRLLSAEHAEIFRTDGHGSWYGAFMLNETAGLGEPCTDVFVCPYGKPGDLLWVRENFSYWSPTIVRYAADGACNDNFPRPEYQPGRIRSSIHMPRWASRLTLKITDVRVERVQKISERDAKAEGVNWARSGPDQDGRFYQDYRYVFKALWDSINAKSCHGWDLNPWVWAISFEVIKQNVDEYIKSL